MHCHTVEKGDVFLHFFGDTCNKWFGRLDFNPNFQLDEVLSIFNPPIRSLYFSAFRDIAPKRDCLVK